MGSRRPVEPTWVSTVDALRLFIHGATVASASRIALVVGTWLSLVNEGSALVHGHVPWVKVVLNYVTPFVVASLGFLAARRRRNVERLVAMTGLQPSAAELPEDGPNVR